MWQDCVRVMLDTVAQHAGQHRCYLMWLKMSPFCQFVAGLHLDMLLAHNNPASSATDALNVSQNIMMQGFSRKHYTNVECVPTDAIRLRDFHDIVRYQQVCAYIHVCTLIVVCRNRRLLRQHLTAVSLHESTAVALNKLQEEHADEQDAVALEEAIETHGGVQWVSNLAEIKLASIDPR